EMLESDHPKLTGIKFKVAQDLMNRALGKPKETIEVTNNTVRELYIYLDQIKSGQKSLDFAPTSSQPQRQAQSTQVIDATATPVKPTKRDEFAEIDSWIEKHVPQGSGLGKKE
ncbi:MAG TPA: hypothetical protein VFZ71_04450, partial [Pyrinomonadaceae bacterium]